MNPRRRESDEALEARLRATMKKELRRSMLALRKALPETARAERSARIAEHVLALPEYREARTIAAYVAMRGEADPNGIVLDAFAQGKTVVLPRADAARGLLEWAPHRADAPLVRGLLGVAEPAASVAAIDPAAIDLVIVPAVALDERGHRIGMGKGFYDRALLDLTRAVRVGVVFDFQLVAEVPVEAHDLRVTWVVTDRRDRAAVRVD